MENERTLPQVNLYWSK